MRLFSLPWTPKVKSRPRVLKSGRTYTDKKTVDAEEALANEYRELYGDDAPFDGPIAVALHFDNDYVHIRIDGANDYKSRKLRGDIDNYAKLVLDALNGVAWVDDKQIVSLTLVKE